MVVQPDLNDQVTIHPIPQAAIDRHAFAVDIEHLADEDRAVPAEVADGVNADERAAAATGSFREQRDESGSTVMVAGERKDPP